MSDFIGHAAILRELRVLAASPSPPHALLIIGPEKTGRTALSLEYARLLNCESLGDSALGGEIGQPRAACLNCRACRLISERRHPDLVLVGPGDAYCRQRPGESSHERHPASRDIRICQVRGVIDAVSRYPVEARVRTVIIEPAERLGRDAAHALLKTLEEPPAHTVFVLVTAAPETILETIRSRCRTIEVQPVARAVIEAGLLARGFSPEVANKAATQAKGRPVAALLFAQSPEEMEVTGRLLERCRKVASDRKLGARLAYAEDLAERWRRDRQAVAGELDAWESFWESRLTLTCEQPDEARAALGALRSIAGVRDDLLTQVLPRPLFELMLLGFPTVTLDSPLTEEASIPDV